VTPSPRLLWTAFATVVCIIALIAVVSFLSDPFGFKARKIERLQREAETAQSDAYARTLESQGQAEQITRIESAGRLTIDLNAITAEAVSNARTAADANEPLEAGRVGRLRQLDDRLCQSRPAVCQSPPVDPAPAGD
jgi:hypothetical protein